MKEEWYRIVDSDGRAGSFRHLNDEHARIEVTLEDGARMVMPKALARVADDGHFVFDRPFSAVLEVADDGEMIFPVVEETLSVAKQWVPREHVRVRTTVSSHEETVDLPLAKEQVRVTRIPMDRPVTAASEPHQEGDTWIVPIYEEVLFVEKRLVLREEVHVTRVRKEERATERVTLRKMDAAIEQRLLETDPPAQGKNQAGAPRTPEVPCASGDNQPGRTRSCPSQS